MSYYKYKLRQLQKRSKTIQRVSIPKRTRPTFKHAMEVLEKAKRVRNVVLKVDEKNLNHLIAVCEEKHQNYTYCPYFNRLEKLVNKYEKAI